MYVLTVSVMGALDLTITSGLYAWGMSPHWSKAVATIFGFIGNFLLRKYLVFPERPAHADLQ
jgi:putative flippase GtrA